MKLIYCPKCYDVVRLFEFRRKCFCGQSAGRYKSDLFEAVIYGEAIPLGINNQDFIKSIKRQPDSGSGKTFEAFVIPKECATIEKRTLIFWE